MLKIIGLATIAVCCAGIGMMLAHALSERVAALELALAVIGTIAGELSFTLAPPDEMVRRMAERPALAKAEYLAACDRLCRDGMPFPDAWRRSAKEQAGALSEEDRQVLSGLADTLGQSDLDAQLASIAHARELIGVLLAQAREKAHTHTGLYRTLGVLSGVLLVILWI